MFACIAEVLIEVNEQAKSFRGDVVQLATVKLDIIFFLFENTLQHFFSLGGCFIVEIADKCDDEPTALFCKSDFHKVVFKTQFMSFKLILVET